VNKKDKVFVFYMGCSQPYKTWF